MRFSGATLIASALLLVGAAPAAAFTGGFGAARALHSAPLPVLSIGAAKRQGKLASCHAAELRSRTAKTAGLGEQLGHKAAPVACEQPPRSELVPPNAFKHAAAAALAIFG